MVGYQFYCLDEKRKDHLIGILPERRFNPERITHRSIINWAKEIIGDGCHGRRIRFVRVNLSTPQSDGQSLPSTRDFGKLSRAPQADGLKVHPEPRFVRSNG